MAAGTAAPSGETRKTKPILAVGLASCARRLACVGARAGGASALVGPRDWDPFARLTARNRPPYDVAHFNSVEAIARVPLMVGGWKRIGVLLAAGFLIGCGGSEDGATTAPGGTAPSAGSGRKGVALVGFDASEALVTAL